MPKNMKVDRNEGENIDREHGHGATAIVETNCNSLLPTISACEQRNSVAPAARDEENRSWKAIGLIHWLIQQLNELNLKDPTPVQSACIPRVLSGHDVLGCAKTGTGKTLAFALPIIQKLSVDPFGIFALVLTPTRELAYQIDDQFRAFGQRIFLTTTVVVGGRSQMAQAQELANRPHIIVATPGRLADHVESDPTGNARLFRTIRFLVLDEADRLLDGQYALQLQTIFKMVPKQRQTLLFSATLTSALSQLHQVSVRKPYFYREAEDDSITVDRLDQRFVICPRAVRDVYLVYVVKNFCAKRNESSVIVFAASCRECHALSLTFKAMGFEVGCLHSQIQQRTRLASLARFRSKKIRILICTDVASRGLDIPHVDLVVNHNVPRSPKTYVHRIGRSARAGRFGAAITFVTQHDIVLLQAIETSIGRRLEKLTVNDQKVSTYAARVLATKKEVEIKMERANFGERRECYKRKALAEAGLSPNEIDRYIEEWKRRTSIDPSSYKVERSKAKICKAEPKEISIVKKKRQKNGLRKSKQKTKDK